MIEDFMDNLRVHVKNLEIAIADRDTFGFLQQLRDLREDIENIEEACER